MQPSLDIPICTNSLNFSYQCVSLILINNLIIVYYNFFRKYIKYGVETIKSFIIIIWMNHLQNQNLNISIMII